MQTPPPLPPPQHRRKDDLARRLAETAEAVTGPHLCTLTPATSHSPPTQRRRKDDLERRLAEIEEAVRIFSRKQVLVRM